MPGHYPGAVSRGGDQLIEAHINPNALSFGDPLKLVDNKWEKIETSDAETLAVGVAVRSVEQGTTYPSSDGFEIAADRDVDGLIRGYIAVEVKDGSPAVLGQVYIIDAPGDSGLLAGDFVTTVTVGTGTTIAPANWKYRTAKDSVNNTAEIHILAARI